MKGVFERISVDTRWMWAINPAGFVWPATIFSEMDECPFFSPFILLLSRNFDSTQEEFIGRKKKNETPG